MTDHQWMEGAFKFVEAARAFEEAHAKAEAAISSLLIEVAKVDHAFALNKREEGISAAEEALNTLDSCVDISSSPSFINECRYWYDCLNGKISLEDSLKKKKEILQMQL